MSVYLGRSLRCVEAFASCFPLQLRTLVVLISPPMELLVDTSDDERSKRSFDTLCCSI